jgi:uncharacterized protein (TIGR02145 family)
MITKVTEFSKTNCIVLFILLLSFKASSQTQLSNQTVKIKGKEWTKFNLNKKVFNTGDSILEAKTALEWVKAYQNKIPAYCQYPNSNGKYGLIYNIHAINDFRGLAPEGFRIAKCDDWSELGTINMDSAAYFLRTSDGYFNGINTYGFSALPGGFRAPIEDYSMFWGHDYMSVWWSENPKCKCIMYSDLNDIHIDYGISGDIGAYVRCIKE